MAGGCQSGGAAVLVLILGGRALAQAEARFGSTGLRHPHTVASVRYSRDGGRVITACWDKA